MPLEFIAGANLSIVEYECDWRIKATQKVD